MAKAHKVVGGYEIKPHTEARYFKSAFMEAMSKCPGWLPLLVWVPIFGVLMWQATATTDLSGGAIALLAVGGFFFWSFAEYWLHRKFFHWRRFARFHFLIHGSHHEHPHDFRRVVFPPSASLVMGAAIWGLVILVMGFDNALPFFAGFVAGYLWYDMTHYWTHVGKARGPWGKFLKRHHMLHHFDDTTSKFGVSSPLWDFVFGTYGAPAFKRKADASGN